jgi:hypothetical protein
VPLSRQARLGSRCRGQLSSSGFLHSQGDAAALARSLPCCCAPFSSPQRSRSRTLAATLIPVDTPPPSSSLERACLRSAAASHPLPPSPDSRAALDELAALRCLIGATASNRLSTLSQRCADWRWQRQRGRCSQLGQSAGVRLDRATI